MGGFGALNLAMRHPEVFGAVYALAPGLYSPDGLESYQK
jgi:S-formylglutathione hydrolase FrmB